MGEHRAIWAAIASALAVIGASPLLLGDLNPSHINFWVCWSLLVGAVVIFALLVANRSLPGGRGATKPDLHITHIRTWGEMRVASMPTEEESRQGQQGLIEVIVKCYAALPPDAAPVQLKSAEARIRLDATHVEVCEGQVSHWVNRFGGVEMFPEGFSHPPLVPSGKSIELRCGFYVGAFRPLGGSG